MVKMINFTLRIYFHSQGKQRMLPRQQVVLERGGWGKRDHLGDIVQPPGGVEGLGSWSAMVITDDGAERQDLNPLPLFPSLRVLGKAFTLFVPPL